MVHPRRVEEGFGHTPLDIEMYHDHDSYHHKNEEARIDDVDHGMGNTKEKTIITQDDQTVEEGKKDEQPPPGTIIKPKSKRVATLDAFRGLTIVDVVNGVLSSFRSIDSSDSWIKIIGSMDFVVPLVDASVFFPMSVRFTAASTFSELKVLNVLPLRGGPSPRFAQRTLLSTENYQVLITRSNDTEVVVQERLRIYNEKKNVKTPNIFADEYAEKEMRKYIKASLPVIEYIDKLYVSRNISLDW
ncbi:hypothetical protein CsSME_00016968 [Camellia sinensis var. sinensis]